MKHFFSSHNNPQSEECLSRRIVRREDVEAATGIAVVSHLPLKERLYLVETNGRWTAFLSSERPETHQEILQMLLTAGRIPATGPAPELFGGKAFSDTLHVV